MRSPEERRVSDSPKVRTGPGETSEGSVEILLSVRDLSHHFSPGGALERRRAATIQALRGVSLDLFKGECLAVVGESGSGKTTLARAVLRLIRPTGGEVLFRGRNVLEMSPRELMAFRRKAQIVFQDPFGSLNPRLRAGDTLEEVLRVHGGPSSPAGRRERVAELLRLVGLSERHGDRYPHELSGGQRQRLGIARALSVGPELLVLDEPVSALDLSVRAQVLTLLQDLQRRLSLTMLLVAHDLAVVRQVAGRVVLMYAGTVVESAPVEALFADPVHPYTRGLLAAADPGGVVAGPGTIPADPAGVAGKPDGAWAILPGEPPSTAHSLEGCPFHRRCPHPRKDRECELELPELADYGSARRVACWKEGKTRTGT